MGRKRLGINRERIAYIIKFVRMKKSLSQLDIVDEIDSREIGFMKQPALSAIETACSKASIRNIKIVLDVLGLDHNVIFGDGLFESLYKSKIYDLLSKTIPDSLIKIYCYIFDAYFAMLPKTDTLILKKRTGLKYPNSIVKILEDMDSDKVLEIFSYYKRHEFVFDERMKIEDKHFNAAVGSDIDHFYFFCLNTKISIHHYFSYLNNIEKSLKELKFSLLKDWNHSLRHLESVCRQSYV